MEKVAAVPSMHEAVAEARKLPVEQAKSEPGAMFAVITALLLGLTSLSPHFSLATSFRSALGFLQSSAGLKRRGCKRLN